jgi:hypothetical protein
MNLLFRAYFHQKKLAKNLCRSGSGRFRKSDPDPVKNHPDLQREKAEFSVVEPHHVYAVLGRKNDPYHLA